jgi:M61 glycyl aminopeptidase
MLLSQLYRLIIQYVSRRLSVGLIFLWLLPASVFATDAEPYARYLIRVNSQLSEMQVELCFSDEVAETLSTESDVAHRALKDLHINGKSAPRRDRTRHKIYLTALAAHQCLDYKVNLKIAETEGRIAKTNQQKREDVLLRISSWLWLPDVDTSTKHINFTFELPTGISISVPWKPIRHGPNQHSFELGRSPTDWQALMAIGRFDIENIAVTGATLRLAVTGSLPEHKKNKIRRWIAHGATSTTNIFGRFPLPSPQILVVPIGKQREPVPWGQVLRGGTPAVHLFIDAGRPYDQFSQDWTLVHELSHFLHPNMGRDGAWLAEGLASYYQNIAQARAGTISDLRAWQKLHEGFQRGIAQTKKGKSLAYESRHMSESHDYMRVYWSGAAIALLADFSLRKNGQSLDEVMSSFQQCCLMDYRYWSTEEFMNKLDTLSGTAVFSRLHDEYVHSDQFPDLQTVYGQMGFKLKSGKVSFDDEAKASHIRQQIMSAPEAD